MACQCLFVRICVEQGFYRVRLGFNGGCLKKLHQRQMQAEKFFNFFVQHHDGQRVSARIKKVLRAGHIRIFKNLNLDLFNLIGNRSGLARLQAIERRVLKIDLVHQRPAVDLAIGQARQRVTQV